MKAVSEEGSITNKFYLESIKNLATETYAIEKIKNHSDQVFSKIKPVNFIDIFAINQNLEVKLIENVINPIR